MSPEHAAPPPTRVQGAQYTPRWLRRAAVFLLLCWGALGLLHTSYVMVRPHGLIIRRPPELARTIGLPGAEDGRTVVAALDLIAGAGLGTGPVLVVRPEDAAQPFWDYVHFQLAQLSYPRRVDLIVAGASPPLEVSSYAALLAPMGVTVDPGWELLRAQGELLLYGRSGP